MPSWLDTSLPAPQISGAAGSFRTSLSRSNIKAERPPIRRTDDVRTKTWNLEWILTTAQLKTAETFLKTYGYSYFLLPLISSDFPTNSLVSYQVRLTKPYQVGIIGYGTHRLSATVETAPYDPECIIVNNESLILGCLDTIVWPAPSVYPECFFEGAIGTTDDWPRLSVTVAD